ncbi:MAG: asparagine synthase (glutamine-hydrolyzing) [Solirubrobacteraceae bacterium]
MCGIAAVYGRADVDAGRRMLGRLAHRGPDDVGDVAVADHAWLGHARLSIVDLAGGRQPLGDETLWLVGNGEMYNHAEVRQTLDGALFDTDSDNEVALHLVVERGPEALAELRGMWAICLAGPPNPDPENRPDWITFLAARDPLGIKPLYWARRDGEVRFASEIRAFDEDWRWAVETFPPGCAWTPERGLVRFADAVPPEVVSVPRMPGPKEPGAPIPDDILRSTRETLAESVDRHMMADVDVGVFLSGGLDSSLIAALAADFLKARGRRLKTFAVGTERSSDLLAARVVAEHLDTDHHEAVYTADQAVAALDAVIEAIESFDPSLVRSAVPNWFLAQLAARHVKVVLTGEGADELYAGYGYYHDEFEDPAALHGELVRTIRNLHDLNLQRADRVTMAHGLEARVPFLDREVIAQALSLAPGWKASDPSQPQQLEKRVLRHAFDGWLPDDILWRPKEQFGDGSGAADVLQEALTASITPAEFERERGIVDPPLRTPEELAYHRIYARHLGGVRPERTISRFAES